MASETSAAEIVAESDGPLESPPDPSVEPSYGAYYYAHDCGIPYERNEHWLGFFDEVARGLIRELRPQSTLDAGCAFGMLVEALRNHGVDASGIDLSSYAISQAPPELAPHLRVGTLTDPLPGRYDLITCVEVIEHLDPADAARALDNLTAATDRLLLCSTPTDYAEPTHVYVRQPEEWAADLAKRGFVRDLSFDGSFLTPWTLLFVRSTLSPVDVVRTYEREHWRMKHEVGEVREAIIALHNELERVQEELDAGSNSTNELRQLRTDLLTTRDELIGTRAELGEALGTIRRLEVEVLRTRTAAHELDQFRRAPVWRVYSPYQRLRSAVGRKLRAMLSRAK